MTIRMKSTSTSVSATRKSGPTDIAPAPRTTRPGLWSSWFGLDRNLSDDMRRRVRIEAQRAAAPGGC